jgi:hypothetical protein
MEVNVQLHAPAALLERNSPGTYRIEVWVNSRTVLDAVEKRHL